MSELFLKIINMSISASWLVLAVLALRLIMKKAPKWFNVILWGIVAIRLICPFSIESAMSLIPSAETIPMNIEMADVPSINSGVNIVNNAINPVISSFAPNPGDSANPLQIWIPVLSVVWVSGMVILFFYTLISYWRLRRKIDTAVIYKKNIFQSENVDSPFVLGIIKPRIYLPFHMDEQNMEHVVAHEQAHIRRKDHWWKPLGFLLLTIHWFNPFMWIAYVLLCRDIELACDEKVIKELGDEQKADYTRALVACSVNRRMIAACPIAFGEVGVKDRVKSVMNYKKPAFWIIVVAVISCVVVAVCFLTNPAISVDERLAVFLDCEIASQHQTEYSKDNFCCLDWEVIGKEQSGNLSTVYMWVLYREYSNDDVLTVKTASHHLTVITAKKENGNYKLVEYWIPEDGSYYTDSIKEKVPMYLWGKAFDSQRYIDRQSADLERMAIEHFAITEAYNGNADAPNKIRTTVKWFDFLENPDEMIWDGSLEITMPEFPEVTFRWSYATMEAVVDGEIISIYTGKPIWNAYFCDLTGDGLPELCSSLSWGSGMIDNRVIIYDYAKGQSYSLQDRGTYDYTLRQDDSDGRLYVDKKACMSKELLSTEALVIKDGEVQFFGEDISRVTVGEITDPTDDANFNYDTAIEKIYEDENNEYFLSGLYSQYVIVYYTDGMHEDIVTALNSGRVSIADLDRFGIEYLIEPKVDSIDATINKAILSHFASDMPDGLLHCASFVSLAQQELCIDSEPPKPMQLVVYGMALHEKYGFDGGTLHVVESWFNPVKFTFEETEQGAYRLIYAWFPEYPAISAEQHQNDIYAQFSTHSEDLANSVLFALLDGNYLAQLKQESYAQAVRYSGVDTYSAVEQLFEVIESSPSSSSKPSEYITAHQEEYEELIYYGNYTLEYIFSEFLEGGQTGLRGQLMRIVLDDLVPEAQLRLYAETGQEYFDEWKAAAVRVSEQHDMDWIEQKQPAIFLFLQMINK